MLDVSLQKFIINSSKTIMEALNIMDKVGVKLLVVSDDKVHFKGLLSIGDIQRAILSGVSLSDSIISILRKSVKVSSVRDSVYKIKTDMLLFRSELMPVINDEQEIVAVYLWQDFFNHKHIVSQFEVSVNVIIDASFKNYDHLNNLLPPALHTHEGVSKLEIVINKFVDCSATSFNILVPKDDTIIKHCLSNYKNKNLYFDIFDDVNNLKKHLQDKTNNLCILANCIHIVCDNWNEILKHHLKNKSAFTNVVNVREDKSYYKYFDHKNMNMTVEESKRLDIESTGNCILSFELFLQTDLNSSGLVALENFNELVHNTYILK
jgi:CBS domain-containing protein